MKAKSIPQDTTKSQNDTRDPENPQTNPKSAPTDVNDADDGPNEAQKLDGPGPKPLDEVAREHGGDAGKLSRDKGKGIAGAEQPSESKEDEEEDEDGPNAKSKGEGTGEQYVKSNGLNADGGDFDATKPGAGREADRKYYQWSNHALAELVQSRVKQIIADTSTGLMGEKGMHVNDKQPDANEASADGNDAKHADKKDKKSIGQKIKEKLHRH